MPNAESPSETPSDAPRAGAAREVFVGRQPILDNDQTVCAFELLFRDSAGAGAARVLDGTAATSKLLVNTFNSLGIERVLGGKRAFINVSAELLLNSALETLPPSKVVLEILETIRPTPTVVARCRKLVELGYSLALDDFVYHRDYDSLIALAEYVKLDIRALGVLQLAEHARLLPPHNVKLLAEKVETQQEFRTCRDLRFEYYQGYYFARPETLTARDIDPQTQRLMRLFNLAATRAELGRIALEFKPDVALSLNLLRYLNSAGFGLGRKLGSVQEALLILGYEKLARWLSLLMLSGTTRNVAPNALFRVALTRARLMELLGARTLPEKEQDYLFMTGMLSLLDAMLDAPLATILKNLTLPDAVSAALLQDSGPYAPYLQIARAAEQDDPARVEVLARALDLGLAAFTATQLKAFEWADQVGSITG